MNWKDAVKASRHSFAVAYVEKGHALRLVNAAGTTFRIDSPQAKPAESSNSKRMLGRLNWQPVAEVPKRFKHFTALMEMAHIPVKKVAAAEPTLCDLHAGQQGLAAMIREWHDRRDAIKKANETLQGGTTSFDDPELPNLLDEIIDAATKMRALL
jgi:hypothetical protein